MIEFQHTKESRKAIVISLMVHVAILLLVFFCMAFRVPDPPLDSGTVSLSLADFGMDDKGSGEVESETVSDNQSVEEEEQTTSVPTEEVAHEVITQEVSDVATPSSTSETVQETAPEQPQISSELDNILNQINSSSGGASDGSESGTGNEGNEEGVIDGKGIFDGGGWELAGRGMLGLPSLDESPTEEGTVVLNIFVDRTGKVIDTKRDYTASNTSSDYLFRLAEKAAKTAKFNVKSDAPHKQKGSLTFIFKLN